MGFFYAKYYHIKLYILILAKIIEYDYQKNRAFKHDYHGCNIV